ncbi:hypothetical protein [Halorussus sp. MSC15.2]|uniref:hypothetical protein n=1 Tax=Halorussus sp. MSC15.2 TaxID=2283638 RepID=UPI0013D733EF|nr:hypothetical protein [Halorussus sp. MSC15.2]NEU57313.1 hypothetical protein [Halorussus sp. MSC15.2]
MSGNDGTETTDESDSTNSTTTTDTDGSGDDGTTNPTEVIDAYLAAAKNDDLDAMREVVHSSSPMQNALAEDKVMFNIGEGRKRGDTEIVTKNGSVADIFKLKYASVQFDNSDLRNDIGDSDISLVTVELKKSGSDPKTNTWVLVTEGGKWRVFWVGEKNEVPENPESVFEDPIKDENASVVEEITYGDPREHTATVSLTDSPGTEADTIRVEATVSGYQAEFSGSWSGSWAVVTLNPTGDQIVVTAIQNGTEEVVHREHYKP